MTRRDRLRRVVLLSCSFGRNLAFYRSGQAEPGRRLLSEFANGASFWRQANANFLDTAVLEWCKLLGDKKGEHYYGQIVRDPAAFETAMLAHVGMDAAGFASFAAEMRRYRDKFIAHLDSDAVMNIPILDKAQATVRFYFDHVAKREAAAGDLAGLSDSLAAFNAGYDTCTREAEDIFEAACGGK